MEKILSITEGIFEIEGDDNYYEGFVIKTDKQKIQLGIDNFHQCCESFGYFMSEDNPQEFVYSDLIDITITDTCLNTKNLFEVEEGYTMFVNIQTSKGLLQFVAYNEHNGYYGHNAIVKSTQLTTGKKL